MLILKDFGVIINLDFYNFLNHIIILRSLNCNLKQAASFFVLQTNQGAQFICVFIYFCTALHWYDIFASDL